MSDTKTENLEDARRLTESLQQLRAIKFEVVNKDNDRYMKDIYDKSIQFLGLSVLTSLDRYTAEELTKSLNLVLKPILDDHIERVKAKLKVALLL